METYFRFLICIFVFCMFVIFGFYVGNEYAKMTKKPDAVYHTHLHITPPVPTSSDEIVIDQQDKDCLARNIYFEAANQSALGKLAVGLVVLNRVKSSRYPDTICGVVNQKSQFSWVDDSKSNKPKDDWAWKESERLSDELLKGKGDFIRFDDVMHYHANYVSPKWSKTMKRVAKVDQHVFYE